MEWKLTALVCFSTTHVEKHTPFQNALLYNKRMEQPAGLPLDQILQGDCIEILGSFPENSIDLIFADPPYNLQLRRELLRPNRTRVDGVDDAWDHFGSFAEYDDFTRAWLSACKRVLKPTGTIWVIGTYHNIFRVGAILQDLDYWILNDVVWIKTNPMPNFRGVRFTNAHETLIWAQKQSHAPHTFNHHAAKALNDDKQMRSDWLLPICSGKERLKVNGSKAHATQKPEALLYRILLTSSNPSDVVLDPFFGSGTTGVAARRLQRHWIGIERQPAYVELASRRIAEVVPTDSSPEIFDLHEPRREAHLPFGLLLEHGLLKPGDSLFLGRDGEIPACIHADGSIEYNKIRGSIHQVVRQVQPGPCNGWELWYYLDAATGERLPLNNLRKQLRKRFQISP